MLFLMWVLYLSQELWPHRLLIPALLLQGFLLWLGNFVWWMVGTRVIDAAHTHASPPRGLVTVVDAGPLGITLDVHVINPGPPAAAAVRRAHCPPDGDQHPLLTESCSTSSSSRRPSRRRARREPQRMVDRPSRRSSPACAVIPDAPAQMPVFQPPASASGEFDFAGVWESRDVKRILKQGLEWLDKPGSVAQPLAPSSAVHKESVFCGISPLGTHVDTDNKEKIWSNGCVDIWSLVSVDQHTVDREWHVFSEKPSCVSQRSPKR